LALTLFFPVHAGAILSVPTKMGSRRKARQPPMVKTMTNVFIFIRVCLKMVTAPK
jgi:hypothetical protein